MSQCDVSCSPLTKSVDQRCKRKMYIPCFDLKTSEILKILFLKSSYIALVLAY